MDMTNLIFGIIIILIILILYLAYYANSLSRSLQKFRAELKQLKQYTVLQQKQLKELAHEVQTMTNAAHGVGKRINILSGQMRELDDRQEEFDLKEQGSQAMHQAIALAQKGATIDELMDTCDMSRGEAELLMVVHGDTAE